MGRTGFGWFRLVPLFSNYGDLLYQKFSFKSINMPHPNFPLSIELLIYMFSHADKSVCSWMLLSKTKL